MCKLDLADVTRKTYSRVNFVNPEPGIQVGEGCYRGPSLEAKLDWSLLWIRQRTYPGYRLRGLSTYIRAIIGIVDLDQEDMSAFPFHEVASAHTDSWSSWVWPQKMSDYVSRQTGSGIVEE